MELRPILPPNAEDWQPYRAIIARLYRDENWSLTEVQQWLKSEYGFKASEKMYKNKVRLWGLDKKLKEHEVREILHLQAERAAQGKSSTFALRGRSVNMDDIHRYARRKKLSLRAGPVDQQQRVHSYSKMSSVPDLVCRTPSPVSLVADPGSALDDVETFYLSFNQYLLASVEAGVWRPSNQSSDLQNSMSSCGGWVDFLATVRRGTSRFIDGDRHRAVWHWRVASTQLESITRSWNYYQLLNLMGGIGQLAGCDLGVANMLLQHLNMLVKTCLKTNEPQKMVLQNLSKLDPASFDDLLLFTRKCCLPVFESHFSEHHQDFVLFWETALAQSESNMGVWKLSSLLLARVTERLCADGVDDRDDIMLMNASERLVDALTRSKYYSEAEFLSRLRIRRLQALPQTAYVSGQLFRAWAHLGLIQLSLEKWCEAHGNFSVAIDAYENLKINWGTDHEDLAWKDRYMKDTLAYLIDFELKMGLLEDAEQHLKQHGELLWHLDKAAFQKLQDKGFQQELICEARQR